MKQCIIANLLTDKSDIVSKTPDFCRHFIGKGYRDAIEPACWSELAQADSPIQQNFLIGTSRQFRRQSTICNHPLKLFICRCVQNKHLGYAGRIPSANLQPINTVEYGIELFVNPDNIQRRQRIPYTNQMPNPIDIF